MIQYCAQDGHIGFEGFMGDLKEYNAAEIEQALVRFETEYKDKVRWVKKVKIVISCGTLYIDYYGSELRRILLDYGYAKIG